MGVCVCVRMHCKKKKKRSRKHALSVNAGVKIITVKSAYFEVLQY